MTVARYGGLKRATIIVREDGKLDVIRERATNGERFNGLENLDEAFATIRAHDYHEVQCEACGLIVEQRHSYGDCGGIRGQAHTWLTQVRGTGGSPEEK